MLKVAENTKLYAGIRYLEPAVGIADYWIWRGGDVPDGPGAYAFNGPVPDVSVVKRYGLFCAAVPNLLLRRAGKVVPTKGDPRYDGGIAAYFSGLYGAGYFSAYDVPFDLATAKRWARETRSGVLLGRATGASPWATRATRASCCPAGTCSSPPRSSGSTGTPTSTGSGATGRTAG